MWLDGLIATDDGDVVAEPAMSLRRLQTTKAGAAARLAPAGPGYLWATLRSLSIDGMKADVAISIHKSLLHDCISSISITFYPSEDQFHKLNVEVSSSEYERMMAFYLAWIKDKTGKLPPVQYRWGSIYGGYDMVEGCPFLRFNYT